MKSLVVAVAALVVAGAAGGAPRPFAGTIAFSGDNQILEVGVTSTPAQLTNDRIGVVGINWSPDGTRLLAWRYRKTPAVAVLRADGSLVRTLVTDIGTEPAWSPDGTRVAFQRRQLDRSRTGRALYVIGVDGRGLRRVASNALPPNYGSRVGWSPDGRELVYAGSDKDGFGIYAAPADGSGSHRLVSTGKTFVSSPSWSSDGADRKSVV